MVVFFDMSYVNQYGAPRDGAGVGEWPRRA